MRISFQVGKTYFCRSACDYDCIWTFRVISRTTSTVTFEGDFNNVDRKTLRIPKDSAMDGIEYVMPFGRYSMAPCLSADQVRK